MPFWTTKRDLKKKKINFPTDPAVEVDQITINVIIFPKIRVIPKQPFTQK